MKTDAERILTDQVREKAMRELANIFVNFFMENGFFRSCVNCEHWSELGTICTKFEQRPPTRIIVTGCEHHTDNIPF